MKIPNSREIAGHKVLIVIPALNEEKCIKLTIIDLKDDCPAADIVVIDDGSQDKTGKIVQKMHVRVLKLPFNLGIGGAVQTGFKYAAIMGYDIVVQFDADHQHVANEIPGLIAPILSGNADVVIGSRFINPAYKHEITLFRRIGISIFRVVNKLVTGRKITDNTSGFRAYNKQAIEYLSQFYPIDYPEPESVVSLIMSGFKIVEVPVKMRKRIFGKSSIKALYYMFRVPLGILLSYLELRGGKK